MRISIMSARSWISPPNGMRRYMRTCWSAPIWMEAPPTRLPIRAWEFLPVVGTRAGLFGNETGRVEAWVYPLKIFREFHLTFHVGDRALPAESLARTLTVRPESANWRRISGARY